MKTFKNVGSLTITDATVREVRSHILVLTRPHTRLVLACVVALQLEPSAQMNSVRPNPSCNKPTFPDGSLLPHMKTVCLCRYIS